MSSHGGTARPRSCSRATRTPRRSTCGAAAASSPSCSAASPSSPGRTTCSSSHASLMCSAPPTRSISTTCRRRRAGTSPACSRRPARSCAPCTRTRARRRCRCSTRCCTGIRRSGAQSARRSPTHTSPPSTTLPPSPSPRRPSTSRWRRVTMRGARRTRGRRSSRSPAAFGRSWRARVRRDSAMWRTKGSAAGTWAQRARARRVARRA
mmetsp:Transcript_24383/g.60502  ORF Transcript_24383/g.60502 Transcript_24383/m.60502 type:complete len:208 (-) Transcript_24383:410-1033(-)